MKTVIVKNGRTEYELFEDQEIPGHPGIIDEAIRTGESEYKDSYGATWTVLRNDGPQKYVIRRAHERLIVLNYPNGDVSYQARYVATGNSFCGGGWKAAQDIEDSYTPEERRLLGLRSA
jgi:hypothetical protein